MGNLRKRRDLLPILAALLALGVASCARRSAEEPEEGRTERQIIRLAHYHLQQGVREAIDELAREYEALHPGIRVEQIAVPERVWPAWLKTQLIGGTAPEILAMGNGLSQPMQARWFSPLSEWTEQANPYNRQTPLEGRPWESTFLDGLRLPPNFSLALMDVYGIPNAVFVDRLFCNPELLEELTGWTATPGSYEELIEACREIRAASEDQGRRIVPIAASRETDYVLAELFSSQTQRLKRELDVQRQLEPHRQEYAFGYLRGEWDLRHASVQAGLRLMSETAGQFAPGFDQLRFEDALFAFSQGRAVFMLASSSAYRSILAQCDFEVEAQALPFPDPSNPRFAPHMVGPINDGNISPVVSFGLRKRSDRQEQAIDFLRFLTSWEANRRFAEISGWLPAVVEVPVAAELEPLRPRLDGYVNGFWLQVASGGSIPALVDTNLYLLAEPLGSVDRFVKAVEASFGQALYDDLEQHASDNARHLRRQDVAWATRYAMELADLGDAEDLQSERGLVDDTQNEMEANRHWFLHNFDRYPRSSLSTGAEGR